MHNILNWILPAIGLLWLHVWGISGSEDVFAASAHMKMVASGERILLKSMQDYIRHEEQRLKNLTR